VYDPTTSGTPDTEIIGFTDLVNAIPGVCTIQSCAGHLSFEAKAEERLVSPAHVWLRVTEPIHKVILETAPDLVSHDLIEEVNLRFGRCDEGPIVEIIFAGRERGMLDVSAELIVAFLAYCSKEGTRRLVPSSG
jgi:hypothetical protein